MDEEIEFEIEEEVEDFYDIPRRKMRYEERYDIDGNIYIQGILLPDCYKYDSVIKRNVKITDEEMQEYDKQFNIK